ncbi:MAG: HAD family hydrolase [Pseudomonadota bacterium]
MLKIIITIFVSVFSSLSLADELPSWREGATKNNIITFVESVTTPGDKNFVPINKRIAVFDNDGTLWSEKPYYFQLAFALDRLKELAPDNPEWQQDPILKAALEGDIKTLISGGKESLLKVIMLSHTGITTEEFNEIVIRWTSEARHPATKRLYIDMVYQPMLELLEYLRAKEFETWIVSGGGIDFMRAWSDKVYGIPPEQVIGSSIKTSYKIIDGIPTIIREPQIDFINDKSGKPVGIHKHIGIRPIAAFGNSDGDLEMLQWTTAGDGGRLGVIIHHTDAEREYAYDKNTHIGRLDKALTEASIKGWTVVNMKKDWGIIFPME